MDVSLTRFGVQVIKQGRLFIAYSHKLDIATTGKSEDQAMGNFADLAKVFAPQKAGSKVDIAGAANRSLIDLGWTNRAKRWFPPATRSVAADVT